MEEETHTCQALFLDLVDIALVPTELHDRLEVDEGDFLDGDLPSSLLFIGARCVSWSLNNTVRIHSDSELMRRS